MNLWLVAKREADDVLSQAKRVLDISVELLLKSTALLRHELETHSKLPPGCVPSATCPELHRMAVGEAGSAAVIACALLAPRIRIDDVEGAGPTQEVVRSGAETER